MENEVEIPDFVAEFSEKGFETKPGIQFAGAITSNQLKAGERAHLMFIVQNALDAIVEGKINITVPSSKWFKSTNISTISPVEFTLKGTEAERILIPIQTRSDTPEGEYEVQINIKGAGDKEGNRVRGKKEGKDWGKAAARSVAESVAVSAISLFFGRVAIRVYTPSDNLKTSFVVKGQNSTVIESPLEISREKLWNEAINKSYETILSWINNYFEKDWKTDENLWAFVTAFFHVKLDSIFQSKHIIMSDEELDWLGRLMTYVTFGLKVYSIQNLAMYPLKKINTLYYGKEIPEKETLLNSLNFMGDVIHPWLVEMKDDFFMRCFVLTGGIAIAGRSKKIKDMNFLKESIKYVNDNIKNNNLKELIHFYFEQAITESKSLFPENEIMTHLSLLKEKISQNKLIEEKKRKLIVTRLRVEESIRRKDKS